MGYGSQRENLSPNAAVVRRAVVIPAPAVHGTRTGELCMTSISGLDDTTVADKWVNMV